jgi:hypothetical protein
MDEPLLPPRLPVADAGPDLAARVGVPIAIDGSNSRGRSGVDRRPVRSRADDFITFQWTIVQAPAGSAAAIDASSAAPLFVAEVPGPYILQLVVTDSNGVRSAPDRVTVMAYADGAPPNPKVGRDRSVRTGTPITLDASRTTDPEGGPITYLWWLVSKPQGSRLTDADISSADSATPVFTPDVAGTYELQLQASDGQSNSETRVAVEAVARSLPPFADAGQDQRVRPGEVVQLSGSGNGSLSWTFLARPAASGLTSAAIRGADSAAAEFTPDAAGTYILRLTAIDGREGDADNVLILVKENQAPRAEPDSAATSVYLPVDIDVLANDSDPDGEPLSVLAISQGSQGSVEILPHGILRYRPVPGALGSDSFQYSIGDGHGGTASATVTVAISTLGQPLVESFSPPSGRVGDVVMLAGANLSAASAVNFAGVAAQFTVLSPTQIRAIVPEAARSGPIAVFSPGGSFTTAKAFSIVAVTDFAVSVVPASLSIRAGEQGTFQVTLLNSGTSKLSATLSVSGLPEGATAKFVVPTLTVGHSTTLTVGVAKNTSDGDYPLLVTAASSVGSSTITRSASAAAEVFGGPSTATPVVCGAANLSGVNSSISVSTLGQDGPGCGVSWAAACATIAQGIANCNVPCAVLVRHGRYSANATIALRDGVSVYGGCSLGEPPNHFRTVIEANPAPGTPALSATNINSTTLVHGIVVVGKDETANGTASIAMAVTASKGLTLANSIFAAGKGGDGAEGGTTQAQPGGAGQVGNGGSGGTGGAAGPNCPSNRTSSAGDGGNGGDGLQGYTSGCFITCPCQYPNLAASLGHQGIASGPATGGVGGGRVYGGIFCTGPGWNDEFDGRPGAFGQAGSCGAQGGAASSVNFGSPRGASWVPGAGGAGGAGSVGAGGGGGGGGGFCVGFVDGIYSQFVQGKPGGGGGGGGCGGNGGSGGEQGGASISLMLVNSTVAGVPNQNSLIPGPGGRGGTGGLGGPGGPGGSSGPSQPAGPTTVSGWGYSQLCPAKSGDGGPGGQGGAGGGGAGGNGGPSIGIALVGGSPDPGRPGIYFGLAGAPGARGPGGQNASQPVVQPNPCKAADGADGIFGGAAFVVNMDNPPNNVLLPGETLTLGQSRTSPGGIFLIMQTDSNFCLYTRPGGTNLWCSNTAGSGALRAAMQTDGNLVLYTSSGAHPYDSATEGHPGAYLVVEDNGHAVIYDGTTVLWRVP